MEEIVELWREREGPVVKSMLERRKSHTGPRLFWKPVLILVENRVDRCKEVSTHLKELLGWGLESLTKEQTWIAGGKRFFQNGRDSLSNILFFFFFLRKWLEEMILETKCNTHVHEWGEVPWRWRPPPEAGWEMGRTGEEAADTLVRDRHKIWECSVTWWFFMDVLATSCWEIWGKRIHGTLKGSGRSAK